MGTGSYGHASAILLKGQEKAAATRAKKKREAHWSSVTAEELAERLLSHKGRICPSCFRQSRDVGFCAHRHPEDNEIFEIPTVEVEYLLVAPGTAQKMHEDEQSPPA